MNKNIRTAGSSPAHESMQFVDALKPLSNEYEAAAWLNCKVPTLRAWRVRGGGPEYCKIGRLVRYPRESLIAFANKQIVSSTAAAQGA